MEIKITQFIKGLTLTALAAGLTWLGTSALDNIQDNVTVLTNNFATVSIERDMLVDEINNIAGQWSDIVDDLENFFSDIENQMDAINTEVFDAAADVYADIKDAADLSPSNILDDDIKLSTDLEHYDWTGLEDPAAIDSTSPTD